MTDYSTKTDDEINRLVADELGWTESGKSGLLCDPDGFHKSLPDYATSIADAWGLLEGREITIKIAPNKNFSVRNDYLDIWTAGKLDGAPRLICELFLRVKQAEREAKR